MSEKNKGRFWVAFILGILGFGIYMIIWTVKSASSVPVHESNDFMLKYQRADRDINSILNDKKIFDSKFQIELQNKKIIILNKEDQNSNSKRKQTNPIELINGENYFAYTIKTNNGIIVNDANMTFLLTRPHTRNDDNVEENIQIKDGIYKTQKFNIIHPGRYSLQTRIQIGNIVGYSEISAYLKP